MEKWGQANTYSGYRHGFGRDLHRENLTQPEKSGRDVEDGQQGPKQQLRRGVTVLKALAVRTMFVIHSVLVVWRVVDVKDNDLKYWCMLGLLVVLVIEGGVTIYAQNGEENKWWVEDLFCGGGGGGGGGIVVTSILHFVVVVVLWSHQYFILCSSTASVPRVRTDAGANAFYSSAPSL